MTSYKHHRNPAWSRDLLMDEWDFLRREGHTIAQAAERLGIKPGALDRAICRAARAGDVRAVRRPLR